jgi:hypothetical protein
MAPTARDGLLECGEGERDENVEIEVEAVEAPCPVREQCDQKAAAAGRIARGYPFGGFCRASRYANAFEGIRPPDPYFDGLRLLDAATRAEIGSAAGCPEHEGEGQAAPYRCSERRLHRQ